MSSATMQSCFPHRPAHPESGPAASHLVLELQDEGILPGQLLLGRLQEPRVLSRGLGERVQLLGGVLQVLAEHDFLSGDKARGRRRS